YTIAQLLERGHRFAVVLNSDSPTLPTSLLVETAHVLAQPGDRAVFGPALDGGYYLLGLKAQHHRLFEDIAWSTERVAQQTLERAAELKLPVHILPTWYDVDDVAGLEMLRAQLFDGRAFAPNLCPARPRHTRALIQALVETADLKDRLSLNALRRGCGVKRITGLDWPLLALGGCLLALSAAGAIAITQFDDPNVGVFLLLQCVPYAIAAWLVLRGGAEGAGSGRALATILIVGIAMRCLLLPGTPVSTDLFRYVWDGRVQAAGFNPYLYIPSDAALSGLRDSAIYPNMNRADYAPGIYPPTAQFVFYLITRISEAPIAMKAAMVAFEGLAVWAMLQLLALRGLPRSRILLYAWHPLPLWEFARSGHVDIVAIAFLLLAFLATERRSPILAGVALGAGALVKYFH